MDTRMRAGLIGAVVTVATGGAIAVVATGGTEDREDTPVEHATTVKPPVVPAKVPEPPPPPPPPRVDDKAKVTVATKNDDDIYGGIIGTPNFAGVGGGFLGNIPPPSPKITNVTTTAVSGTTGSLAKAIVRRYLKRQSQKLQYCYEKALIANPALVAGTVTATFTIGEDGKVTGANTTGVDPSVASCVKDVVRTIEFPKPRGAGGVVVTAPIAFKKP